MVAGLPLIGTKGGALGYKVMGRTQIHDSIIINTNNLPSCLCALPVYLDTSTSRQHIVPNFSKSLSCLLQCLKSSLVPFPSSLRKTTTHGSSTFVQSSAKRSYRSTIQEALSSKPTAKAKKTQQQAADLITITISPSV